MSPLKWSGSDTESVFCTRQVQVGLIVKIEKFSPLNQPIEHLHSSQVGLRTHREKHNRSFYEVFGLGPFN